MRAVQPVAWVKPSNLMGKVIAVDAEARK